MYMFAFSLGLNTEHYPIEGKTGIKKIEKQGFMLVLIVYGKTVIFSTG